MNQQLRSRFVFLQRVVIVVFTAFTIRDYIINAQTAVMMLVGVVLGVALHIAGSSVKTQRGFENCARAACFGYLMVLAGIAMLSGQGQSTVSFYIVTIAIFAPEFLEKREALMWTALSGVMVALVVLSDYFIFIEVKVPRSSVDRLFEFVGLLILVAYSMWSIRDRLNKQIDEVDKREKALQKQTRRLKIARDEAIMVAQVKARFLANMSHEIRTPLNGVIGMSDVLSNMKLNEETRGVATTISQSGRSLLRVVNDILDFSKLESGHIKLKLNVFEVREVVEDVLQMFGHAAWRNSIDLSHVVDPAVPTLVIGDASRLQQVLINLVGNAIKFTTEGRVTLAVEAKEDNVLRFSVHDTGPGIPEEHIPKLFEEFTQVDNNMAQSSGGTGLGLAISRNLVELMDGTIEVVSKVGIGSTFAFDCHFAPCDQPPSLGREKKHTVLVLSPQLGTRDSFEAVGQRLGLNMICLEELSDEQNDLVDLCFVSAAYGDALQGVMSQLKTMLPDAKKTMITTMVDDTYRPKATALGFDGTLTTPLSTRSFLRLLDIHDGLRTNVQSAPPMESKHDPLRVLVAEDNRVNRMVIGRLLEVLTCEVDFVVTGAEAVDAVKSQDYDLVLMDVHMPVMDGLEATRNIRKENNELLIVALTASVLQEQQDRCAAAGMNDFLSKPVELDKIRSLLRKRFPDHFED